MTDFADGFIQVQYNNPLNPSQLNDSLIVGIYTAGYYDPVSEENIQGGGGIFSGAPYYGCNGYPFPPVVTTSVVKSPGSRLIVYIRKRKMGIVTISNDTVKAYPHQTTIIPINW